MLLPQKGSPVAGFIVATGQARIVASTTGSWPELLFTAMAEAAIQRRLAFVGSGFCRRFVPLLFQGTTRGQHRSCRTLDAKLTCSVCRRRPWSPVQQPMASSPCHCGSPCLPRAIAKPSPPPKHTTCCHERTAKHGEELLGPLRKIAAAAHTDGHSHRSEFGKHNAGETFVRLRARTSWQEALASLAPRHVFYISTAVPLKARRPCIHRNTFWSDQTKKSFLWIRGGVGFKTCPAFCRKHAQGLMWHVSPQSTGV